MPSGRKKRHAARRRSIGANTGTTTRTTSFDKESVSGSHVSDEATSPKTSDEVNTWLSVATGTSDRPGDQTFHTEEWVRVSDFDVGTPTSTTHKSDYDAVTEDSYGDVRAQDKLVDWETVNAGTSSSTDDVGEVVVEHPSRPRQDQVQKLEKVLSDSSEKDGGAKSVSSKDSHSSSSSSNSTCSGESPSESRKKSDDEERSSSIVVVPSHGEKSSSASVDPRDDDFHGSSAHFSSPEAKEDEHPAIEAVSSDEQEQDDSFAGVEEQAISTIEPASSEEGEEEKYRLFTDVSNLKDLLDQEESSGDSTAHHDTLSTFLSSSMKSSDAFGRDSLEVTDGKAEIPEVLEEEHQQSEMEEKQEPDAKEVKELEQPIVEEVMPEPHASENLQGENTVEESAESIEPTTPVKASSENPYSFTRSVSDEEIMEPDDVKEQGVQSLDVDENIAKESQDASFSSGIPPPDQHELNQLLEIAHSKEIAQLGKQEEKLLLKEEEELGKGITEPQPLIEVLSATDDSKPLERGELKDLQPVVAEEAPLLKGSPSPAEPEFQVEAALKDKVPELFSKESNPGLNKETHPGLKEEHLYVKTLGADKNTSADLSSKVEESLSEHSKVEESLPEQTSESKIEGHSSSSGDQVLNLHMKELSTKNEDATLVPLSSIPDSKSSEEQQVAVTPYLKIEEQGRPSRSTSMDAGGCCEPMQWIFETFARWVSPRAIQN